MVTQKKRKSQVLVGEWRRLYVRLPEGERRKFLATLSEFGITVQAYLRDCVRRCLEVEDFDEVER